MEVLTQPALRLSRAVQSESILWQKNNNKKQTKKPHAVHMLRPLTWTTGPVTCTLVLMHAPTHIRVCTMPYKITHEKLH